MNKNFLTVLFLIFSNFFGKNLFAKTHHGDDHPKIFHSFILESDVARKNNEVLGSLDLDGWIGSDENRLWLKSEQKKSSKDEKQSEAQALYSRKIADFWDAQIGIHHDFLDKKTNYLTLGFQGLAPYFFETDAHIFLSDDGNLSARLKQEIDILITQKLIIQPYFEADVFASDVDEKKIKSGLSELEIGALTRYEISRKFAPYFALRYKTKTFATANLAEKNGEKIDDFVAMIGIRLRF